MPASLRISLAPVLLVACAGLILSGCGRKGDLDVPGAPVVNKIDKAAKPVVEERPFLLDPLL